MRATRLAPAIADFPERVAEGLENEARDSLPYRRAAVELDPENADRRMRLATQAELERSFAEAERSLVSAAQRSRLYQPRYLLAGYYFRRGDSVSFWPVARAALEAAHGDCSAVLDLCWRMRPDSDWLTAHVLPPRPVIARRFLAFLVNRRQWAPARRQARAIAMSAVKEDVLPLLDYCDASLTAEAPAAACDIWNTLCERGLIPGEPLDRDRLVTNGDFRRPFTGRGFDWRASEQTGVRCAIASGGLRVTFSGHQPERCPIAWQYVPAEPGVRYRARAEVTADSAEAARAITWEAPGEGGSDQPRLVLVYQRPPGSPRLAGSVSIAHVQLERVR